MAGFNLEVRNIKQVIDRLEKLPQAVTVQVIGELKLSAEEVRAGAVKDAPGDQGRIRNSIQVVTGNAGLLQSVQVNSHYAPYMEWGTKRKKQVPGVVAAYAAQFKGAGQRGTVGFKEAIDAWVKRKGIGLSKTKSGKRSKSASSIANQKRVAFLIRRSIAINGVTPHPFFFKHVFLVRKKLEDRLKRLTI